MSMSFIPSLSFARLPIRYVYKFGLLGIQSLMQGCRHVATNVINVAAS
jgi:hypothetical protein